MGRSKRVLLISFCCKKVYINSKLLIILVLFSLVVSLPISSAAELNLIYDGNGNLITGDGKYREYNEFNQLIRVREGNTSSGRVLEEYLYHPTEDRVLIKYIYNVTAILDDAVLYVNDNFVRSYSNAGGTPRVNDTYYVRDEQGIVAEVVRNVTYQTSNYTIISKLYYHNDHLGSASVITNQSGDIIEQTFYEPFGGIIAGGNFSRYDYEGREFDSLVGDYDFRFRKYDPQLKIFTQGDAGVNNVYDPQELNRYTFEKNNPYKYTDPNGKEEIYPNALSYYSNWVADFIMVSYIRNWRENADTSNLNTIEWGFVRTYDVVLSSQIDISYWRYTENEITRSVLWEVYPQTANEDPSVARRAAIFGIADIALGYLSAFGYGGKALSQIDTINTWFSVFTGGGIAETVYQLDQSINGGGISCDQYGCYSTASSESYSGGSGSGGSGGSCSIGGSGGSGNSNSDAENELEKVIPDNPLKQFIKK